MYELVMSDNSAIDSTVFTFDSAAGTLTTTTSDGGKIGTYEMKLTAKYGATYTNVGSVEFDFTIDPCEATSLSLSTSPLPKVQYTLG